jgi:hypothetical protein
VRFDQRAALIGTLVVLCAACSRGPYKQLVGTWDWAEVPGSCTDNPFAISFSPDKRFMILTYRHPVEGAALPGSVFKYEIRGHTRSTLHTAIVDPPEVRRTEAGELVEWDVVLTGRDEFRWREVHWIPGDVTKKLVRCAPR